MASIDPTARMWTGHLNWMACAFWLATMLARPVSAQVAPSATVLARITTQNGTVRLPGVAVTATSNDRRTVATEVSDSDGIAHIEGLPAGVYQLRANLSGFDDAGQLVRVAPGDVITVDLDMPLTGIVERVDVIGNAETATPTIGETLSTKGVLQSRVIEQLPIQDNSVLSALKLLAGILDGPQGLSIKGGRTNQTGLQIGMASLIDTSTGAPLFRLPVDAIDSVEVLPNPYAVEFGRFSSGLTVINTRSGGDRWRLALSTPELSFRMSRTQQWKPTGIESFGPRVGVSGPLVKNRLFIAQSAQMRYDAAEVYSRPPDQLRTTKWISAFTRVDARLAPGHSLIGSFNYFPSHATNLNLNTFNGPDVAADQSDHLITGGLAAHSILTERTVLDSTVQFGNFRVDVDGHGTAPMLLIPSQNEGNFFNRQHRVSETVQWVETLVGTRDWHGTSHLFKAGLDLMHTNFHGTSSSSPVQILREDRTLARQLTFTGPSTQHVEASDVAVFAQDRVQAHSRLLLEFGGRADRDGVLGRTTGTPRVGVIWLMDGQGTSVLRGGFGLFFERTPSVVDAFDQFEMTTDTRYAADGLTPLGPVGRQQHVTGGRLDVARSATWNLEWNKRATSGLSLRVSALSRHGSREVIVNPVGADVSRTDLLLTTSGRSSYREGEVTVRYAPDDKFEVTATYVRSSAFANLNAYTSFFNNVRWPVIDTDQYAPVSSDAPNRLIAHSRLIFRNRWLLSSILELHDGFPFSATNEMLDWVGPRNQAFHFPFFAVLDLDIEHKFTGLKGKPWIGLRAYNALNRFSPAEVQSNLQSPAFGSFYNSRGRQIRLQVRFD